MKKLLLLLCLVLLGGCFSSGPEKTLANLATALTNKDSALFLAQLDMRRFAAAHMQNVTADNPALRTLDSMGQMLGMGGVSDMLGDMVDTQGNLTAEFKRGVSTGELALACKDAQSPQCPWVAASLKAAKVKELNSTAAVAQVTTPSNISSWLALSKVGDVWLVVGQAPMEEQAAKYATADASKQPPRAPAKAAPQAQPPTQQPQKPEAPTAL